MVLEEVLKRCRRCHSDFPLESFSKDRGASDGLNTWCRSCCSAAKRAWRVANPEKHRQDQIRTVRRNYRQKGLTAERFEALKESQADLCIMCGKPETLVKRGLEPCRLSIDHDHRCCPTQKACGRCVRWLACHSCNQMLGHAKDNVAVLRRAADLLEDWQEKFVP